TAEGKTAQPLDTVERWQTPEQVAEDLWGEFYPVMAATVARGKVTGIVRTDREHIAKWCLQKAGAAEREAAAHPDQARVARCEGQASAFKALAALLAQESGS